MMLKTGIEYFWKRTDGWDWFGTQRWWEIFIEVTGLNGAGGYWIKERWRWNNSTENMRENIRTLSFAESKKIEHNIRNKNNGL